MKLLSSASCHHPGLLGLGTLVAVAFAACGGEPAAETTTSRFEATAPAFLDPGLPGSYYGPKCVFEHSVGKAPECISAVLTEVPLGVHLFLNFCVRNGVSECQHGTEAYVSLLLPIPRWETAGSVAEARGGRAWMKLHDGRVHEARAEAKRPVPIDLQIVARPVTGGGVSYLGTLQMTLPRVDADGAPLIIKAQIP